MSTVKANNYYDTTGGSNAQLYGVASPPNSMGFRNRILNGGMVIDQRNGGASITPSSDTYTLDRWQYQASQASKFAIQQNRGGVTPPAGFSNYLGMATASAVSIGSSDYFVLVQRIEGFNASDFAWGTANAQTITLSFSIYSSLTGTFGGSIRNGATNRSYAFSYTISAANTWERKTITIAGDTSGTWATDNTTWASVIFGLGVGSSFSATAGSWGAGNILSATGATSVVGTNGATFYITGVQLEAGTVASPFERRDYGRELMMCQRYYVSSGGELVGATSGNPIYFLTNGQDTGTARGYAKFPVTMRTTPTVTLYNNETGASGGVVQNGVSYLTNCTAQAISINGFGFYQNNNNNFQTSVRFISAFYFANAEL